MNGTEIYKLQLEQIEEISKLETKPTMVLHSCCGPCNTYPMEYLSEYFDLTLFFNNSNIYPEEEYTRRFDELVKYVEWFKNENNVKIDIIRPKYDNDRFYNLLKHRADDREGGIRCMMCYAIRMKEAMQYASENNFDYMSTVMTISPHKDSEVLNVIGGRLEKAYPNVSYFYSNFKKKEGYKKSVEISKKHNMYRQTYCGCQFSIYDNSLVEKYKEDHA
jgi:predicted adenine nucleotide alpha hydrolase (AANH) superfamily ATPase